MKVKAFYTLFYTVLFVIVFRTVFAFQSITGGDYNSLYPQRLYNFLHFSFSSWQSSVNLGQSYVPFLNYAPVNAITGILSMVITNADLLERVIWWIPYLVLSFISIRALYQYLFPENKLSYYAPLIYIFNTYALIIISGGQVSGIGLAYAVAPYVLLFFIRGVMSDKQSYFKDSLLVAVAIAVQAVFDIRIVYVLLWGVSIFFLFYWYTHQLSFKSIILKKIIFFFVIPLLLVILLHSYWLLPTILFRQNPLNDLGAAYTTKEAVDFLSFAKFENTFGLLHPNWPENIFGKTSFMRPEFLVVPLLAFLSLMFVQQEYSETKKIQRSRLFILFFSFLALTGAFLAKGSNEPFGIVYLWLFEHVPGFVLFRDSTKWYILIAVSYSVLLPFSINYIVILLSSTKYVAPITRKYSKGLFILLVTGIYLFTIRFALTGNLGGVLQEKTIATSEYQQLNTFLSQQKNFFRTIWVPTFQRLGIPSLQHPAISAQDTLGKFDTAALYTAFASQSTYLFLHDAGVRYVIIPDDTHGEIFLRDRKYSSAEYRKAIENISRVPWLTKVKNFGKIQVYELTNSQDRIYTLDSIPILWRMQTPANYQVTAGNDTIHGLIVFSDAYSPYWVAASNGHITRSVKYREHFNSFFISDEAKNIQIYYEPERWIAFGQAVSGITLVAIGITLGGLFSKQKV